MSRYQHIVRPVPVPGLHLRPGALGHDPASRPVRAIMRCVHRRHSGTAAAGSGLASASVIGSGSTRTNGAAVPRHDGLLRQPARGGLRVLLRARSRNSAAVLLSAELRRVRRAGVPRGQHRRVSAPSNPHHNNPHHNSDVSERY